MSPGPALTSEYFAGEGNFSAAVFLVICAAGQNSGTNRYTVKCTMHQMRIYSQIVPLHPHDRLILSYMQPSMRLDLATAYLDITQKSQQGIMSIKSNLL